MTAPPVFQTRARLWLKALFWQALGLLTMLGVGFAATGSLRVGGGIALVNAAVGLLAYVAYERLWAHVGWGLRCAPPRGRRAHEQG